MRTYLHIQSLGSAADCSLSLVYIGSLPEKVEVSLLQLQLDETR